MPQINTIEKTSCITQALKSLSMESTEELGEEFVKRAQEELNETEENVEKCTEDLRRLILAEDNLYVPTDKEFLLKFLRARKFNTQKSFHMLQRYYVMKLRCPELFKVPLPSENTRVFELQAQWMLPDRDQFGQRVYMIRVDKFDATHASIEDVFRTNVLSLEQIVREPQTQIAGLTVVVDMAGLSLQHAKFFTPYYARRTVEVVQETFPLRFKGFHVVNEPFYFDAIMAVLKPFLKEKIRKRISFLCRSTFTAQTSHLSTHSYLPISSRRSMEAPEGVSITGNGRNSCWRPRIILCNKNNLGIKSLRKICHPKRSRFRIRI